MGEMRPGLVSITMPAYNAEPYIRQAIESVLAQTYAHWELVIVDDGSTDNTRAAIGQFNDPRIVLVHQANGGEGKARNTALTQASGEFLAFLDADDAYLPQHLEKTVAYLGSQPDRGAVYVDGYYCHHDLSRLRPLSSRRRGPFEGRLFEQAIIGSDVFGPPGCVVLRRSVVLALQLSFDEDLRTGTDSDFFIRCADVADFGNLPDRTYLYRLHPASISSTLGLRERAYCGAKRRSKIIKMKSFRECALESRFAVFYDLMVDQLRGDPESQSQVSEWPEFKQLPAKIRAKLLRLAASQTITYEVNCTRVGECLEGSRRLDPWELRTLLLLGTYRTSPTLCRMLLRIRKGRAPDPLKVQPLADMHGMLSRA